MNEKKECWALHPEIIFREEDDGGIIFDPRSNEVKILNPVGASICRILNGSRRIEDIIAAIEDEFEVGNLEETKEEISLFINQMETRGIIGKVID